MGINITFEVNEKISNGPKWINVSRGLTLPNDFSMFDVNKVVINPKRQMEMMKSMCQLEIGWQGIVCGDIEYCRLFAHYIAGLYAENGARSAHWHRSNATRYIEQQKSYKTMYVVDALITFDGNVDPIRFGNVFDFASEHRGKSSVLIVCGGMDPQTVIDKAHLRPDYLMYLRTKQKREV